MKAIALISGGIDSPVAAHLMMQKMELIPVHFELSEMIREKALDCIRKLGFKETIIFPYRNHLFTIATECKKRYQCVICRRMMFRIAAAYAKKINADAIVTGESLAQVASQTLQNLCVESQVTDIPIIRPLIGFDKNESIAIAKRIGTYDLSIKAIPCGCPAPIKPATSAKLDKVLEEESKLDIKKMVNKVLKSARQIRL